MNFWTWLTTVVGVIVTLGLPLLLPAVQSFLGKFVAGFVDHGFNRKIEELKSELRQAEQRLDAELQSAEANTRLVAETALRLQSSRHEALTKRRLEAVEAMWKAKIATDKWLVAANMMSGFNIEEILKSANEDDPKVQKLGKTLDDMLGVDFLKDAPGASAQSERPFLPPNVWALFSAYQSIIIKSVMVMKMLSIGSAKYLKQEDTLQPVLLLVLPEFKDYILKYGRSGYVHLLGPIERKLLSAVNDMLEGRDTDAVQVKHFAELMEAVRKLNAPPSPSAPVTGDGAPPPAPTPTS